MTTGRINQVSGGSFVNESIRFRGRATRRGRARERTLITHPRTHSLRHKKRRRLSIPTVARGAVPRTLGRRTRSVSRLDSTHAWSWLFSQGAKDGESSKWSAGRSGSPKPPREERRIFVIQGKTPLGNLRRRQRRGRASLSVHARSHPWGWASGPWLSKSHRPYRSEISAINERRVGASSGTRPPYRSNIQLWYYEPSSSVKYHIPLTWP